MSSEIATVVYVIIILGLFLLDRDGNARTSRILWIPVLWFCLAMSRSVSQWFQLGPPIDDADRYMEEGDPVNRLVYMGLIALGLAVLAFRRQRVGELISANKPVFLFFLYCGLSILWSNYPDVAGKRWIKALGDLVMIFVVLSELDPGAAVKRLLSRATFLLIPLSILFIKYYPHLAKGYSRWTWEAFYVGVATSKNGLGALCLLFGLGALWRILRVYYNPEIERRAKTLIAHTTILAMVLWLFWIADSMTSLGCFVIGAALLIVTNLRMAVQRPAVVHLLVAGILSASVSVLLLGLNPGLLEAIGRNPTLTDRTDMWALVLSLADNSLLGTGFESFWLGPRLQVIWNSFTWGPNQAHNGYIEVFLNLGWVGIALLGVVLIAGYLTVFAGFREGQPTGNLMLAYFVVGLVYNVTEAALFRMMTPVWMFLLLALIRTPQNEPSR